jgi:hypothetical protein
MDFQVLFNVAVCVAGFFGGWTLNRIYSAIDRLDGDVRTMPMTYVTKDDWKEAMKEIRDEMREMRQDMKASFKHVDDTLGAVFKRLEAKEDKVGK